MRTLLLMFLALGLCSCSSLVRVPDSPRALAQKDPKAAYGEVTASHVDKAGRIDFKGIQKDPGNLLRFLKYVAEQKKLGNKAERLAYLINSYNALSMYNVIDSEFPTSLGGLKKVNFFYTREFVIDMKEMSLYAYENDVIRKQGDPRVHFALNCMCRGCPRLPQKPFTGKNLDEELEAEAKKFMNEERNVRVDKQEKKVFLSEILKWFEDDFVAKDGGTKFQEKSILAYVNRYRSKKVPEDFEVDIIPYDWTVNQQPVLQGKSLDEPTMAAHEGDSSEI